ncbi:MAG: endospore germination permease [Oscillospiraceae bacterium]|nr:endospore germination permease [Oscillospiraceae bacterium]
MLNGKINGKQASHMLVLYLLGSSLVTGGSMTAKQDSWICILFGTVITIPLVLVFAELNKTAPGKDFFEMSYEAFGKFGGGAITVLFIAYTIHLGGLVIRNFSEYFQVVTIPETPLCVTAICIGALALYSNLKGIDVLGRGSVFIMPFALGVIVLLNLFLFKYMDFRNLKPILYQSPKTIIDGAISVFTFPMAESVLFISVFSFVDGKKRFAKLYLTPLMISSFLLTAIVAGSIATIGLPLVSMIYFPSYTAAGIIDVGNFISRIEVLVSGNYIIFGVIKVSICLFVACRGLKKLFHTKSHAIFALPVIAAMIVISLLVYENTMQMFAFLSIYELYAPLFEAVIPLALLIVLKAKAKRQNNKMPEEPQNPQEAVPE